MKFKLFFVPHYLGSLKYFEKLLPYLEKYEVGFLFLPNAKYHFKEMVNYCIQKQYCFEIINYPYFSLRIPFISPILNLYLYKRRVSNFLNNTPEIKKIISVNDTNLFLNILFDQANKKSIETIVMQWALSFPRGNRHKSDFRKQSYLFKIYYKNFNFFLKKLKLSYNNFPFNGGGNAQKLGVINKISYNLHIQNKINPNKITVIGYIDFTLAEQAKEKCLKYKKEIQQILKIKNCRKNIVIFTTPFYKKDIDIFSKDQQREYYQKIINFVNKILGEQNINIILKVHPAENIHIYKELVFSNLILADKDIDNIKLICLADLYIAHHSTTNFIPIILDKEAIFINFTNLDFIENSKEYLGIKQFVKDFKIFEKLLLDFKNGRLEKQYYCDSNIITEDSLNRILQWIN